MTQNNNQQGEDALLDLVESALEQSSDARDDWLREHCPASLRERVNELIALAEQSTASGKDQIARLMRSRGPVLAGTRVGAYQLIELIGEGGMGQVYLAERADGAFDARVAVKLIRTSELGESGVAQFERERQILSDLRHPGIASLLDGGTTDDGLPYVVMELVEGPGAGRLP